MNSSQQNTEYRPNLWPKKYGLHYNSKPSLTTARHLKVASLPVLMLWLHWSCTQPDVS